mmetsp:Transcript_36198/g.90334  ORF Transcript_36198/g.90334 Transcript_36198/m.90334 type:complete len:187 (+) Transcript_36198:1357-1917(+)
MRVARCGDHLEDTVVNGEQGHIERAATKVEDKDVLFAVLLVQAVRDGGGGGLVDDAHHVEARDGAGVLGRLALRVVEVGGHRDDRVLDGGTKVGLSRLLHLDEDHRRDLLRREGLGLAVHEHLHDGLAVLVDHGERPELNVVLHGRIVKPPADKPLGVVHRVLRVERRLVLGSVADEAFGVGEGNP